MDINFELILSIVGAAAWIPIITMPIINSLRKIKVNLLEFRTLTDGAIPVFSTFDFARATSQTDVLAQTPDDCCDSAESISAPREEE